ncbi:DUF6397 family protein [Streptomyces sp. NPDC048718]|uniref:DUF6397 family protein n=1 Tax=Streptomyces sp. NPDC048718 TaxID=3365587 RepID=UPI00371D2F25
MTVTPGRAARELELKRDEFEFAALTGIIRTVPATGPAASEGPVDVARRRVARTEIERLRSAGDFPDGLRERVRCVGVTEGARLLPATPHRFARLARTGHFSPVRFYVNRYRAVVWLYPVAELREFARDNAGLLTGRLPAGVRDREDENIDWRPRNWRARRLDLLLRTNDDPWARVAAIASLLDPAQLAEIVDDPFERAYLDRFRPRPPAWRPTSPTAREIADRILLADDPDEILWHRLSLVLALDHARAHREAPRPGAPAPTLLRLPVPARPVAAWPDPDKPVHAARTSTSPATAPATTSAPGSTSSASVPETATAARPPGLLSPAARAGRGPAAPGRPPAMERPMGRRVRRSLFERLRGRRETSPSGG